MSDFCKQCADELGFPYSDLAYTRIIDGQEVHVDPNNDEGWIELCEGCGPCFVKDDGTCIDPNCFKQHGKEATCAKS